MHDFSYGIIPLKYNEKMGWEILLIKHHAGHWSFPKGHAEAEETHEQAAERELLEETGLKIKKYLHKEPLKEVYFFKYNGQLIHKTVLYYLAEVTGTVILQEVELEDYCWLPLNEAHKKMTFKQGKDLCDQVIALVTSM